MLDRLTAAASFIWAIAAPKWLERLLESLAKKTVWWLVFFFFAGLLLIVVWA